MNSDWRAHRWRYFRGPMIAAIALVMPVVGGSAAAYAEAAPIAAPGIPIFRQSTQGFSRCTLGFAASSVNGDRLAVTAGHCGIPGAIVLTSGERVLGRYIQVRSGVGPDQDGYALILLNADVGMSANISSRFALQKQGRASAGDEVCLFGTTSGVHCGNVERVAEDFGVIAGRISAPGDSGGPVVRMADHALVGIVLGHDNTTQTTVFEHIDHIEDLAAADDPPIAGLGPVIA